MEVTSIMRKASRKIDVGTEGTYVWMLPNDKGIPVIIDSNDLLNEDEVNDLIKVLFEDEIAKLKEIEWMYEELCQ